MLVLENTATDTLCYSFMGERLTLGIHTPEFPRRTKADLTSAMFPDGQDLPLFSGTPMPAIERPFVPEDLSMKQGMLPGMPPVDYEHVLERDRALRRRRALVVLPPSDDIFVAAAMLSSGPQEASIEPVKQPGKAAELPIAKPERRRSSRNQTETLHPLREALAPYLDFPALRRLAAAGEELAQAYIGTGEMPPEVHAVLDALALMLRPVRREQVKSPQDIAAVFMLEMAHLDQEQLRVACLNTRNRLQKIHVVYQGSLNASMIRVGEIYKEPLRLNSAAIIVAHNHPSGEPNPSPEDVLVTREIVEAGKLLDVECLDHLVIGQGKWVSMRERGLGWQEK
jgi:DNA repair protein RadC